MVMKIIDGNDVGTCTCGPHSAKARIRSTITMMTAMIIVMMMIMMMMTAMMTIIMMM